VRLVKWLPREDLFKEMAECDAFVFASLRDGGGLVVVEAMAAGKPVVCLDLAGPGLHVTEECGIKVAAENPEQTVRDLAAAFGRLARDADLRAAMGRAARRRAEEVYDWKRVAERIEKVYREALGRSGGFTPPNRDGMEAGEEKQSQVAEQAAVEAVAGVGEGGGR
ncbi:MAG TPA: glycosyltransferase family 4 protein, partial [Terriglobia bacterium]|nr:glycosyltransferase family 4 protein [Terriglobia bacterium]